VILGATFIGIKIPLFAAAGPSKFSILVLQLSHLVLAEEIDLFGFLKADIRSE
jgi:hypothetical protein